MLDNLRRGHSIFAFDLIESAVVAADRGPFGELLIVVDAEGLVAADEGEADGS
jgi:hypothetical protein